MAQTPPILPSDYARRNLAHAVGVALDREGHLLTVGERWVIDAWRDLPEPAAGLYARLHSRRTRVFRLDQLAYSDVPDLDAAATQLVDAGLAWGRSSIPNSALLDLRTVDELRALCRHLHCARSGRRSDLLDRLRPKVSRSDLPGLVLRLRHADLFRRIARWFLQDHTGDLSRMVVADLGHIRYPSFRPTKGSGLFRDRRALLIYEHLLTVLQGEHTETDWAELAPAAVDAVAAAPQEPEERQRYSARHLSTKLSRRAIRAVERVDSPQRAADLYERLLQAEPPDPGPIVHRLALCLGRMQAPAKGAVLCQTERDEAPTAAIALTLERTGRRLARAAGETWTALPPLRTAPLRHVSMPQVQTSPPLFDSPSGGIGVEAAVAAHLQHRGREVIIGENAIWTTMFGLLFRAALFAPIPGMLPAVHLHGPLDLGHPGFAERRSVLIAERLEAIRSGAAPRILSEVAARHCSEAIVGVDWSMVDTLDAIATHIPGDALADIMYRYAADYREVRSGMPDLCILPGPQVLALGGSRLGPGLVLAEVKGPTDTIRDNQRCWHHHLLTAGLAVEVWRVCDSTDG